MNIKLALRQGYERLQKAKIKIPHFEAEILLSTIIKKPREFIFTYGEYSLTKKQIQAFNKLITQKISGWPTAYLIGQKEFYGLNFLVNENVLIPRPETELIIDEVKKLVKFTVNKFIVVDVGTGSGCIIITLAKLLKQKIFYGIDISNKALQIAQKNAKINNVKNIKFLRGNLLQPFLNSKLEIINSKLIIIANLPYLTADQIKNSPSIKKEPSLALLGGKDGLDYYKKLLQQIKLLKLNNSEILLEIDPAQKIKIKSLVKKYLPAAEIQIKKDLKGHSRLVKISLFSSFIKKN